MTPARPSLLAVVRAPVARGARRKTWARHVSGGLLGGLAVGGAIVAQGCLDRPVFPITPEGSSVVITKLRATSVDKVDLLLMVDNSSSMADKQSELTRRVPELIQALTDPAVDPTTGKKPTAVFDIHVGVISSSLGSHGTDVCDGVPGANPANNDRGHLMPRDPAQASGNGFTTGPSGPTDAACPTPVVSSAVSWTLDPGKKPAAEFNGPGGKLQVQAATSCVVKSVGETGCGYESQLESIYHFLIDPAPYAEAKVKNCTPAQGGVNCAGDIEVSGVDSDVLAQRKAFLRPDSLLAVILISDENDEGLKPAGANWVFWGLPGGTSTHDSAMPHGWAACASLPDDFEPENYNEIEARGCKWCYFDNQDPVGLPAGFDRTKPMPPPTGNCAKSWTGEPGSTDWDNRNLRGTLQVQRFGVNGLWGRQRYVDGFTQPSVRGSDGNLGPNGIYAGGVRTQDLVVFAAITGVPVSLVTGVDGKPKDLTEADWDKIVSPDHSKRDPHMIESIMPRPKLPLYVKPADPTIPMPPDLADPINGGERDAKRTGYSDLQYACIGKRATAAPDVGFSDCDVNDETNSPLCAPAPAGSSILLQPRFKAYPSLRELRVLHEVALTNSGVSTVAASICADSYSGAVAGVVAKLQSALNNQCIKTVLTQDPTTKDVTCFIAEAFASDRTAKASDPGTTVTKCEDIGPGYCTPGAAPCRVPQDTDPLNRDFQQVSPADAAKDLSLPITVVDPTTGNSISKSTPAFEEGGNVYVQAVDESGALVPGATKHLVCETLQLAKGRGGVSQTETNTCVTTLDANYTPAIGGGWCYSDVKDVIGADCLKRGSNGTVRFLGSIKPKNGSEVFTVCLP